MNAADHCTLLHARVLIPQMVADELKNPKAPADVRAWIANAPDWIEVRPNPTPDRTLQLLDPGEAAALSLAEAVQADGILIDDWAGRTEAERRHLHVTGTLGVLAEAHLAGLVDFDEALSKLRSTNFRLTPDVERLARRRLTQL